MKNLEKTEDVVEQVALHIKRKDAESYLIDCLGYSEEEAKDIDLDYMSDKQKAEMRAFLGV